MQMVTGAMFVGTILLMLLPDLKECENKDVTKVIDINNTLSDRYKVDYSIRFNIPQDEEGQRKLMEAVAKLESNPQLY